MQIIEENGIIIPPARVLLKIHLRIVIWSVHLVEYMKLKIRLFHLKKLPE